MFIVSHGVKFNEAGRGAGQGATPNLEKARHKPYELVTKMVLS